MLKTELSSLPWLWVIRPLGDGGEAQHRFSAQAANVKNFVVSSVNDLWSQLCNLFKRGFDTDHLFFPCLRQHFSLCLRRQTPFLSHWQHGAAAELFPFESVRGEKKGNYYPTVTEICSISPSLNSSFPLYMHIWKHLTHELITRPQRPQFMWCILLIAQKCSCGSFLLLYLYF